MNSISSDLMDLINRMLQPNPVTRINISEIKRHPWFVKNMPSYLNSNCFLNERESDLVSEVIASKLQEFKISLNLDSGDNKTANLNKKQREFCVAYIKYLEYDQVVRESTKKKNST